MSRSTAASMEGTGGYVIRTGNEEEYVTMRIGEQWFGISVLTIQDVLRYQPIASVPLAPSVIAGLLNLRGRIVTAVDLRKRLGFPPRDNLTRMMNVVVEHRGELYSLMVDSVGDVIGLPRNRLEKAPANIDEDWKQVVSAVSKLDDGLLVILDIPNLLKF